jgi:hypothetical protein
MKNQTEDRVKNEKRAGRMAGPLFVEIYSRIAEGVYFISVNI